MKIGIVTIFGDNYGNKLQNFAVQFIVESMGHEAVTLIPEIKRGIRKPYSHLETIKKFTPKYIIKALKVRNVNKRLICLETSEAGRTLVQARRKSFEEFTQKYLRIEEKTLSMMNGEEEWLKGFDYFLCGSDQVWNPTCPEPSKLFFLGFAPKSKRIAIAPSFGVNSLPKHVKPIYAARINDIVHLSVREEQGAKIIKELTGRDATVLADPTLCVSREEWERIEEKPNFDTDTPYVFTYFLGNKTKQYRKYIEKYAKRNGYKIINIFDLRESEYYAVNPAEFVYLIHHAKAVFTDSFHGSVFSIIMNTPFVIFERVGSGKGMSSRIETLLKTFSLENRKFPLSIENIETVNFDGCDEIIESLRNKMDDFLKNAFSAEILQKETYNPYVLENKEDCSGCTACVNVCPKQCIEMKTDSEGFYYPTVDREKCIHCNLCEKVCPSNFALKKEYKPQAYVGYNEDKQVRKNSSSGGIFSALADEILLHGGWVYGAAFDDGFTVRHMGTKNKTDIEKLRTSKYVQSDVRGIFPTIKEQLKKGELVYFSGTPCQVEGLLSYLGKGYEKLYTQDIICHGVPSPAVWEAYLQLIKGKKKDISFRDKKYGWHYFSMRIRTDKKKHIKRLDQDTYVRLFLDNVTLRPSCYACHFKKKIRNSDFTLADCWNGNSLGLSIKDDDKGLSMIFVNSEKGKKLLKALDKKVLLEEIDYKKAIKAQSAATSSVRKNEQRVVFFESAEVNGFQETIKNWYGKNIIADAKKTFIYIKTKIRNFIKRGR